MSLEYITDNQRKLAGGFPEDQDAGDETFSVGTDLKGSGIRKLEANATIIEEVVGDCCVDLGVCELDLATCEAENEAISAENDELNDVIDNIANGGTIVSEICDLISAGRLFAWDVGYRKFMTAGGAGNFVSPKSDTPELWLTETATPPPFNIGGNLEPFCQMRIVGNAAGGGGTTAWDFNPSASMAFLGLFLAGDTCTVEAQWQPRHVDQGVNETPFVIFDITATSASTFSSVNTNGNYRAQDDSDGA